MERVDGTEEDGTVEEFASGIMDEGVSRAGDHVSGTVDERTVMEQVGKMGREGADAQVCGRAMGSRKVERVRVKWGSNDSKKYDGKVEDVPVEWVMDPEMLVVGNTVAVNVGGGRTWSGVVVKLFHQQNALDLALPVKRKRCPSPVPVC